MGFKTIESNSRPVRYGHIIWNVKEDRIPTPNIEFYNKGSKTTTYQKENGDKGNAGAEGVISRVKMQTVQSYKDREDGTDAKSMFRLQISLDSGPDQPLAVLSTDIYDASTKTPNHNGMQLLNSVHAHMLMVKSGELSADTPVQFNLYRTKRGENSYANANIKLPSSYDAEGVAAFEDYQNFVRAAEMPPKGVPYIGPDGQQLVVGGNKVFDYTPVVDWSTEKINELIAFYSPEGDKDGESESGAEGGQADEAGADLAGLVSEVAGEQPQRERMAG